MVIKNLTSKKQKVEVQEISGEHRNYDIFLEPDGSTDLHRLLVVKPERYAGIIQIGDCCCQHETPVVAQEVVTPVVEEPVVEEVIPEETPVEETKEEESTEFICDICGAEFASARGLSSHKNKAHSE